MPLAEMIAASFLFIKLKTKLNDASIMDFLNRVEDPKRKADALIVLELMKKLTNEEPKMWGSSIVGF